MVKIKSVNRFIIKLHDCIVVGICTTLSLLTDFHSLIILMKKQINNKYNLTMLLEQHKILGYPNHTGISFITMLTC